MEINEPYLLYIPQDKLNENYNYSIVNDYILVKTNENCHSQYSSTYCDCFAIYPQNGYVSSETYSCNIANNVNVPRGTLTSDAWYSNNLYQALLSLLPIILLFFVAFGVTIRVFRKAFFV